MGKKIYILAGGGTGGHICPGLAVRDALERLSTEANVVFACSDRQIDRAFLDGLGVTIVPQSVKPLPRKIGQVIPFLRAWRRSRRIARQMLADLKPVAVLGLGGYVAGPAVREAARAGIRTAMLNPDAVLGRANRYLSHHVQAIFTQFESTSKTLMPALRDKIHCVGVPVRDTIISNTLPTIPSDAARYFNLKPDRKTLLVLGGSQGATNINAAIEGIADELAMLSDRWQLLHITGDAGLANVRDEGIYTTALPFCDKMGLAYNVADLVLCRGGASTIGELLSCGKPSVIMPYPYHRDRQQYYNAIAIEASGAGVICEDRKNQAENADALRKTLLPIMRDDKILDTMRNSAKTTAKPAAAEKVARWLMNNYQ